MWKSGNDSHGKRDGKDNALSRLNNTCEYTTLLLQ